jgi:hypothetical protein
MSSAALDQSIQIELESLIVLLVDNSARAASEHAVVRTWGLPKHMMRVFNIDTGQYVKQVSFKA